MAIRQDVHRPLDAIPEARLPVIEHMPKALYRIHRASVKADLRMAKILECLEVADISDKDVDAALNAE